MAAEFTKAGENFEVRDEGWNRVENKPPVFFDCDRAFDGLEFGIVGSERTAEKAHSFFFSFFSSREAGPFISPLLVE